ncbi:putative integral membrane protein [Cryptosporidium felis]|nr:putative integral membrane protein [Cryptosporidium felis]
MKLRRLTTLGIFGVLLAYLSGNIQGIQINRELQNLSIESSGSLQSNPSETGDEANESKNDVEAQANGDENSIPENNTNTSTTTVASTSNSSENANSDIGKLPKKENITSLMNTRFEGGVAYDDLKDGFDNQYNFDNLPAMKEALDIEIGWIIIGICLALLAIMFIVIAVVSVIRHRRNRNRDVQE